MAIITSLQEKLSTLGITDGDTICVSSDIGAIGIPEEIKEEMKKKGSRLLLESYVETLLDTIGANGTLLMPTFTYSACKDEIYNPNTTKSTVGTLTEHFRKDQRVQRTNHTIFSFAGIGKLMPEILQANDLDSFGDKTVFDYLYNQNAKYLLLGINMIKGSTNVYYSEQKNHIPYRYFKYFAGKLETPNGIEEKQVRYFVRNYDHNYKDSWADLQADSLSEGITKIGFFNEMPLVTYRAKDIDELISSKLSKNTNYLIQSLK